MYICGIKECDTVREPVCNRGGPVTAYSVTGTGPGAACKPPKEPPAPPSPLRKLGCRINVTGQGKRAYRASNGFVGIRVC
jgi:hypothetical protein